MDRPARKRAFRSWDIAEDCEDTSEQGMDNGEPRLVDREHSRESVSLLSAVSLYVSAHVTLRAKSKT